MELKDLLGEDYKDGMTIEEVNTILANKNFIAKDTFDKTASELAALKKTSKANEGTLSAQLETQRQQIELLTVKANRQEAARILADSGIEESAYSGFLDSIVSMDGERSSAAATAIASAFKAFGEAEANKARSEILVGAPKPSGAPSYGVTRESFDKMTYTEQVKFKTENPAEYAALFPKT